MPDPSLATILRAVVIVALALCIGAVLAVLRLHWRAYRTLPKQAGLTPLHVFLVSLGVLLLQGTLAWALIDGFSNPITPAIAVRTTLYGVGSLVILAALYVVGGLQHRKVQFVPRCTRITVTEEASMQVSAEHATGSSQLPGEGGMASVDRDGPKGKPQ